MGYNISWLLSSSVSSRGFTGSGMGERCTDLTALDMGPASRTSPASQAQFGAQMLMNPNIWLIGFSSLPAGRPCMGLHFATVRPPWSCHLLVYET